METKLDLVLRSFSENGASRIDKSSNNFSEGSKLKTALKIAGVAGAIGAGAAAGDALNVLENAGDIAGKVGSVAGKAVGTTGKVLSNTSRVGHAVKAAKGLAGFSEKPKTGKMNPKVKKALKVAGAIGAAGALGTAGAIAGDALNLWDLGEVEGVAGKLLSPLDKAGNALNEMASAPALNELKEAQQRIKWADDSLESSKKEYQDLVNDVVRIGRAYERGDNVKLNPFWAHEGGLGYDVTVEPSSDFPHELHRSFRSTNIKVR